MGGRAARVFSRQARLRRRPCDDRGALRIRFRIPSVLRSGDKNWLGGMANPKTSTVVLIAAVLAFGTLSAEAAWAVDLHTPISLSNYAPNLAACLPEPSPPSHLPIGSATRSGTAKRF